MNIQQETFTHAIVDEMKELAERHVQEVGPFDYKYEPDWGFYINMNGSIALFTVRDNGVLVGYVVYIVTPHTHFSTTIFAKQDAIFIEPDYRNGGIGSGLIAFSEKELRKNGVNAVIQSVLPTMDFSPMLEKTGYKPLESNWVKNLGEAY